MLNGENACLTAARRPRSPTIREREPQDPKAVPEASADDLQSDAIECPLAANGS